MNRLRLNNAQKIHGSDPISWTGQLSWFAFRFDNPFLV
jgi:hypothetical protein